MFSYRPTEAQRRKSRLRPLGLSGAELRDDSGSEIVEMGFVMIPLIGVVFLIMDVCWVCFAQEMLQHAVQVGVRSAVTQGTNVQPADVKSTVQQSAWIFLPTNSNYVTVQCYDPTTLTAAPSCSGGYVIQVGVSNVPVSLLGPVIGTNLTNVSLSANSADIMESNPVVQ